MQILPLGDSALLVRLAECSTQATTDCVLNAARTLQALEVAGVVELVPAYTSVAVFYDVARLGEVDSPFEHMKQQVRRALSAQTPNARASSGRLVEIPVCYEPEFALDLADVAQQSGLSAAEVVQRHSAAEYRVNCVGFAPGFPYLAGLPPELATPRRATPRKEVPAGSVAIGGNQTGIYPQRSPGGWNIIGRTAMRLFDPGGESPALLQAGDHVRLRAITRAEFNESSR